MSLLVRIFSSFFPFYCYNTDIKFCMKSWFIFQFSWLIFSFASNNDGYKFLFSVLFLNFSFLFLFRNVVEFDV